MQEKYLQEDEIDLRELFKTIWDKKVRYYVALAQEKTSKIY